MLIVETEQSAPTKFNSSTPTMSTELTSIRAESKAFQPLAADANDSEREQANYARFSELLEQIAGRVGVNRIRAFKSTALPEIQSPLLTPAHRDPQPARTAVNAKSSAKESVSSNGDGLEDAQDPAQNTDHAVAQSTDDKTTAQSPNNPSNGTSLSDVNQSTPSALRTKSEEPSEQATSNYGPADTKHSDGDTPAEDPNIAQESPTGESLTVGPQTSTDVLFAEKASPDTSANKSLGKYTPSGSGVEASPTLQGVDTAAATEVPTEATALDATQSVLSDQKSLAEASSVQQTSIETTQLLAQVVNAFAGSTTFAPEIKVERDSLVSTLALKPSLEPAAASASHDTKPSSTQNQPEAGFTPFRNSEGAQRDEATSRASKPASRASIERSIEKVETAIQEAARSRDGKTLSFRLDPPELGSVKVDVSLKDNALHARVVPESAQIAQIIREKTPDLVQQLRKLGLDVQSITVAVGGEQVTMQFEDHSNHGNLPGRTPTKGGFGWTGEDSSFTSTGQTVLDHWVA